ncbi:uncharacterized protein LOC100593993 [Nomascus leucogenys]|uniref:uncharacterized protein LOC100593993 n=1 Tax=Nomascus leucogenys TaxID=61853 RepID=UPI00062A731E|nr:uncharacterized protein LOC100593993 [Nomascus leucogenys]
MAGSRWAAAGAGGGRRRVRRSLSPDSEPYVWISRLPPRRRWRRAPDTDTASRGLTEAGAEGGDPEPPHPPPWAPSQSPEALDSCSLRRRAADGMVPREGAKGDVPAASSRPSPERLQEQAPSPGAGRRAARESCSARTQR